MASDSTEAAANFLAADALEVALPGPSVLQNNQRASVIVVHPASSENRSDSDDSEATIQNPSDDQGSRDSIVESVSSSPVFSRRRPRGWMLSVQANQERDFKYFFIL